MTSFSRRQLILSSSTASPTPHPPHCKAALLAVLLALVALLPSACGGSSTQGARTPTSTSGKIVERSEGFSSRPGWADENRPWSRSDSQVRVVGYVAIDGKQRKEAGYRAADSYARAELMRFLSVRVVAILEDSVATGEPALLRERIEETAEGVIDDLPVSGRYFERRKSGSEETLHIYSRIDLDQATVLSLLQRAAGEDADLRTTPQELMAQLKERWDRVADAEELNQDETLLPNGFPRPEWAEKGDRQDDSGFQFVCSGVAEDPQEAKAVAQARCNEKLCRLFGVQITAKSTVSEDLDGIEAESSVTEQCAQVRVEGRKTRYQSSECGPQGCVHWFLQTYPKSAYVAERKRLDEPQVIRQQVVIQEGDKHYRDPAACEKSLRAYAAVKEQTAAGFTERKKHLSDALKVCQDIDGRESGLFLALNNILMKPIDEFTASKPTGHQRINNRWAFSIISPAWRANLDTMRFLTDRISAVRRVIDGAILPLQLIDIREQGGSSQVVEQAVKEVVNYPFKNEPASEHHLYYIHSVALLMAYQKEAAYSRRYRNYLLEQVTRARVECPSTNTVSGEQVIRYLAADGELDDDEWGAGLRILKNSERGRASYCLRQLVREPDHRGKKAARVDEIAKMIASGSLRSKDPIKAFDRLLDQVEKEDRLDLYLRFADKIEGSEEGRKAAAENVAKASFGWSWDYKREKKAEGLRVCESLPRRMKTFFEDIPEAEAEDTALCMCLSLDEVSQSARRGITSLLFKYARESCSRIEPADWPGTYYEQESPKTIPWRGRRPFIGHFKFVEDEVKSCVEKNSMLDDPNSVTYLTVTLRGQRMSDAKAKTTIYGKHEDFKYKDGRRGYVHARDIAATARQIESCFEKAANGFVVSSNWYITKEPGPHRIWLQMWDEKTGSSGIVGEDQR